MSKKKSVASKEVDKDIKTAKPWELYDIFDTHHDGLRAETSNLEGLAAVMDVLEELSENSGKLGTSVAEAKMHVADAIMHGSETLKWKYAIIHNQVVDAVEID